jgi:hypothetical protein
MISASVSHLGYTFYDGFLGFQGSSEILHWGIMTIVAFSAHGCLRVNLLEYSCKGSGGKRVENGP